MAAPQWSGGKCKSVGQAKAWFRHNDRDRRLEHGHSNVHIDKALTKYNYSYKGLDYKGLCAAFDSRLSEVVLGPARSGKNARVMLQSVILYPPEGVRGNRARLRRWFDRAGDLLSERYGDNFLDMQIDFDEVHQYLDPKTKEMRWSLEHGHARLFPEVDGKLNGKKFASRQEINELNAALQEMSLREFGCPMMDGTRRKGGKKVEQLKPESEAAEILVRAEDEADRQAWLRESEAECWAATILDDAMARMKELDEREAELMDRAVAVKTREVDARIREAGLDKRERDVQAREDAVQGRETAADRREREMVRYIDAGRHALARAVSEGIRQDGRDVPGRTFGK